MDEEKIEAEPALAPAGKGQASTEATKRSRTLSPALRAVLVPVLAVFTGLVIGAIVIAATDITVVAAYRNFFRAPGAALAATWRAVGTAYGSLFSGSLGNPREIYQAIQAYQSTGDTALLLKAIWPITESLVAATPYIFGGLAVALGFRCGLFNIGVEGQFGIGALAAAYIATVSPACPDSLTFLWPSWPDPWEGLSGQPSLGFSKPRPGPTK